MQTDPRRRGFRPCSDRRILAHPSNQSPPPWWGRVRVGRRRENIFEEFCKRLRCVLFNTSTPCMSPFYPRPLPAPEPAFPYRSRRKEKKPRLDIHDRIVYIGFVLRVRRPLRRRTGLKRSSKPVVGMVIAVIVAFTVRLCLHRGANIGA